jgi:isopropylmalate/homocitrate/citramalate synthase
VQLVAGKIGISHRGEHALSLRHACRVDAEGMVKIVKAPRGMMNYTCRFLDTVGMAAMGGLSGLRITDHR